MRNTTSARSKRMHYVLIAFAFMLLGGFKSYSQFNFSQSELDFNGFANVSSGVTGLTFGPDGRLYVAEYPGTIKIYTVQRNGPTDYIVTGLETLNGVQTIVNHDDDGSPCSGTATDCNNRETIGIEVGGTALNPVIYVSSSDFRIGSGEGGGNGDVDLDTNSGIITRMSWNGASWDVVDLVRGLPRSEENHATNAFQITNINGTNYLVVASGGITNGGAPSTNFVYTCEYALSGAVISINLDMINSMPILTDGDGRDYIYDLPTLDDPTRANVNGITDPDDPGYDGIDVGDPWGGNDGLNQAIVDPTGPVQILSPGYRNAYDLVVTESGALYVTDNGANQGWGGFPENEGGGSVTNNYDPAEPGSDSPSGGEEINNLDHLQLVTTDLETYTFGSYYGGHPNPTRANPNGAGLFTAPAASGLAGAVFRTQTYDPDGSTPGSTTDPSIALPANWPPVPSANPVEGDWRGPGIANPDGPVDGEIVIWGTNTNGIDEYTASNYGGALQGNLMAGHSGGNIRRVELNPDGTLLNLTSNFFSGIGGNALAIQCNGDLEVFPGTVWAGTLNGKIVVNEPQDFVDCIEPGEPGYDPNADYDGDGYTNQDEEDNGTDPCNGGSQPDDFDKVAGAPLISDLNDTDDDADGILDANDPFQLGDPATTGSDAFTLPVRNDLFNDQQGLGGIFGLGMTGLMNNGDTGANWLLWLDRRDDPGDPNPNDVLGGAPGLMTSHMTSGTALGATNTQEKGYQYGVQVDQTTGKFTVIGNLLNFDGPLQLYGNTAAVGGELGHFIGDGTQSNYIKVVLTTDGITALQEINDVPQTPITVNIPTGQRPTASMVFYFEVDPSNGEVLLEYSKDGAARETIGTITAQGSILNAIQNSNQDLAVGFTGTSGTVGVELEGTWDFLNVVGEVPVVVLELPDLLRTINAADEDIDLDNYFDDDGGTANLTYTVETNTNNAVGASISSNILTLTYPGTAEVSQITIRATDSDGFFVEDTFQVTVTDGPIVLYRVNTGGPGLAAIDGDLAWEEDTPTNPSAYLSQAGTNQQFISTTMPVDGSVNQTTTPLEVFATERYDNIPGAPNLSYSFPVSQPGNYEVRLYVGNSFSGTSDPGQRIFDVTLEGAALPLLTDLDLSATYGHETGTVISHIINITDGDIDISFLHQVENPLINAIEILDAPDDDTPIYVFDIADQSNNEGEQLGGSLGVTAYGGDGNLQYAATGLPPGITIEPTNGQIGGTIAAGAASGSPYNVIISIDDTDGTNTDAVTINFQWEVFEAFAFRINAGGAGITSTDIAPDWEANAQSGLQNGGNYSVNTGSVLATSGLLNENRDVSVPAYIDANTYETLFGTERFDLPAAPEMEYTMDLGSGDYWVNLYIANFFEGNSQVGDRIFDISIEGALVEDDFDVIASFGHLTGGVLSYPVTVNDGTLNILFEHVVENPVLNGIEVFAINDALPDLVLNSIPNQQNNTGEIISFSASASGGDNGQPLRYYIAGQPEGITINAVSGLISGTIDQAAGIGGPNGDGNYQTVVTVLRPGSAPATQVFTWSVNTTLLWLEKDEALNYTGRHECSFVQAGDKFYLMGGRENSKTIDVYDYTTNTWVNLIDSAPFDFNHFQAVEYQGLIWIIGAFVDNNFPNEAAAEHIWMFDPATETWIEGPEIPVARRRGSTGLSIYNNKFYISGGNTDGHDGGWVPWFDEFDPATGTWTVLADAPRARDHFHSGIIGDNLYMAGGRLSGGTGGVFAPTIAEVDVYDFNTGTWSTLTEDLPTPRGGSTTVSFQGQLIVIGGEVQNQLVYGVNTSDALPITEAYDPVAGSWTRLPDMNFERHGTQAIVSGEGVFILAGSLILGGPSNQKNMEYLGADNPQGTPSVASTLDAPSFVIFADGETQDIDLSVVGGNIGKFIRDITVSGANAGDFSFDAGDLNNALLNPGQTHVLTFTLNGTGADRSAQVTIDYDNGEVLTIVLSNNADTELEVTNPGNQFNYEGDTVTLPIQASSSNALTYSANGLPPNLTIDPNTGVITGTIFEGSTANGAFIESGGLVVAEAESVDLDPTWTITNIDGETGIIAGTDHLGSPNGGTMNYDIQITTPGVYRFNWNSFYSGSNSTEENDNWLKFPNDNGVWFFGFKGTPASEAALIANLQGAQTDIVFPVGSGRESAGTIPEGNSNNGYFKIYRSGGASETYDWQALTSDNDPHNVYVYFEAAGTYTAQISERSTGHAIDRFALYKFDTFGNVGDATLNGFAESSRTGQTDGAAANSPYDVEITVSDDAVPPATQTINFQWIIGEAGDLIAVPEADPLSGEAPLTVQFTGSNSLDDVGVTSYLWDFMDGSPTTTEADPQHTFTAPGDYLVSLTVGDIDGNSDTNTVLIQVTTPASAPPVVDAGADQEITLPEDNVLLNGTASDPDGGTIVTYAWTQESGPSTASLSGASTPDLLASGLEAGTYVFRLTVTDDEAETAFDEVTVVVNPPSSLPPVVDAGPDQQITLPTNTVTLNGTASDPDGGVIVTYAWTQPSGPSVATLTGADSPDLTADDLIEGTYVFRLTVTDDEGETAFDDVTVVVEPSGTQPPVVDAGADQQITLPTNSVVLNGTASDPDGGNIVTFAWTQESGPAAATLSGEDTADLTASDLVEGTYVFRLTVTDDEGETAFDEVTVEVLPEAPQPPVVDAGPDQTITLPTNVVVLNGSATDPDGGAIVAYLWTQESGPAAATLTDANTASLTAADLVEGVYVFRLTATDDEDQTGFDEVTVTVLPEGALPPIVDAGPDQQITLPTSTIVLNGSATDTDGTVVSVVWTQEAGPSTATLTDANTTSLTASDLVAGSYTFRLTATDDDGFTAFDEAIVLVETEGPGDEVEATILNPAVRSGEELYGVLRINAQDPTIILTKISVFDYTGRLMREINDPGPLFESPDLPGITGAYHIPVGMYSYGIYFVRLEFNRGEDQILKLMVRNP
ncbi:PKD repeat-containing protein [Robiginitalea myxolifaciens]|uniref:PKD repeat-containing protein n=1 Tax=Robiginitalea myxolifaciens TaxID=400055 RepID=A0A1I6H1N2_9FLAO|nr:PKD domain-containing protein [Robiginitalea myxolifaciens]SFR48349.1 PKD repeat-containing protein [Robiginitalea myxolifaciens]